MNFIPLLVRKLSGFIHKQGKQADKQEQNDKMRQGIHAANICLRIVVVEKFAQKNTLLCKEYLQPHSSYYNAF
jgi:hypothetical protein